MTEVIFDTEDVSLSRKICGNSDTNLRNIQKSLDIELIPRGTSILIKGDESSAQKAEKLFHLMTDFLHIKDKNYEFEKFDLKYIIDSVSSGENLNASDINNLKIFIRESGKTIFPKTRNQIKYINYINNSPITFAVGPAGTGKTYLAVVMALNYFQNGKIEKIILTRPAVEAGENLGFLPGDLVQKINPYLRPLYDSLFDALSFERVSELIEKGIIEIAPLAYMRGRTLNNAFIILDEAQNTTAAQMKMVLTRLGNNSKIIINGDITQIDLDKSKKSGLINSMKILKDIDEIKFVKFQKKDISRHPIVEKIVAAYESKEKTT